MQSVGHELDRRTAGGEVVETAQRIRRVRRTGSRTSTQQPNLLADDEVGAWAFVAVRGCAAELHVHTQPRTGTPPYLVRVQRTHWVVLSLNPLPFSVLTHHIPLSRLPKQLPHARFHHGLAQHIQQRPKYQTQLRECRQFSATLQRPGKLANIRSMGCLRRGCPACQRVRR